MTELRPHRPALSPGEAAAALRAEVSAGRLDGAAVDAVLRAAGHRVRAAASGPPGASNRAQASLFAVQHGLMAER